MICAVQYVRTGRAGESVEKTAACASPNPTDGAVSPGHHLASKQLAGHILNADRCASVLTDTRAGVHFGLTDSITEVSLQYAQARSSFGHHSARCIVNWCDTMCLE